MIYSNRVIIKLTYFVINNPYIFFSLFKSFSLNNVIILIFTHFVKKYSFFYYNKVLDIFKLNLWEFFKRYLLLFIKSNKNTLDNFIKIFDILIKDVLKLKYLNIIYGGSTYCYLNNIKFLEIETNLFMYITILLSLVHLYNFILQSRNFMDSFLKTNKFKLFLIILIGICFVLVSIELSELLDSLISKFLVFINSFLSNVLNRASSRGSSPQGGPPSPRPEAIFAAQDQNNRNSTESEGGSAQDQNNRNSMDSESSERGPFPEEIPEPMTYPPSEIGLKGSAKRRITDTGIPTPLNWEPIPNRYKPNRLEDLAPSTSWRTYELNTSERESLKNVLQAADIKDLRRAIAKGKSSLINSYKPGLINDEKARRIMQEQDNITNTIDYIKRELKPDNIEETKTMVAQFLSFHRARVRLYKNMCNYKKVE